MGNIFGGNKRPLSPEEEQRRLQARYGVLVPPVFTVSRDDGYASSTASVPVSSQHLHQLQVQRHAALGPSIVEYFWRLNAGNNLLTEYMTPGLFFSGAF